MFFFVFLKGSPSELSKEEGSSCKAMKGKKRMACDLINGENEVVAVKNKKRVRLLSVDSEDGNFSMFYFDYSIDIITVLLFLG